MGSIFGELFSQKHIIYWVESLVIVAIVIYLAYIAYALKLFRKE